MQYKELIFFEKKLDVSSFVIDRGDLCGPICMAG